MHWLDTFKKDIILDYAEKIVAYSMVAANVIRNLAKDKGLVRHKRRLSYNKWFSILIEFIYFYLHLTDRFAFGHMDEERRGILMTGLAEICIYNAVYAFCKVKSEDKKEKIIEECMKNCYIWMEEYCKYEKWFPEKGEGLKDTLFGEFGANISKIAIKEVNIFFIMPLQWTIVRAFEDLDIESFIEKVK